MPATPSPQQEPRDDRSIIRRMPPELSNKIAAGEVVQRPASVVRELLDNALDAGARQIRIVVQQAGKALIQVSDDGCGMGPDDLRPCLEPHATSKIQSVEDLFRIRTMGFRGEAMASIASISQMEIRSRRHEDDTGWRIAVEGGEEQRFEPVAVQPGTQVSVRHLFFNVPARRQFLRSDPTELRYIMQMVQQAAMAHPEVGFELISDGDPIYRLPPQPLLDRIDLLFGTGHRASMIPMNEQAGYLTVSGYLSDPKLTRKSRGGQFLFVNRRAVQHRVITHRILSLYEPWIRRDEYPFFAVFLDIDPAEVDVNVHPAKMEVKFADERSVVQLAASVAKKALHRWLEVPDLPGVASGKTGPASHDAGGKDDVGIAGRFERGFGGGEQAGRALYESPDGIPLAGGSLHPGSLAPSHPASHTASDLTLDLSLDPASIPPYPADPASGLATAPDVGASGNPTGKPEGAGFWQLHGTYILTQTRSGVCVIDQHAAHKRIIYEKALNSVEEGLPGTQQLLFSQTVDCSATDFALLKDLLPHILRMGFSVQLLSGNSAVITGVPADIDVGDEKLILSRILHQYRELDRSVDLDERHKVALAFASRTAIPRGKALSGREMDHLIDQLFSCSDPYRDPLGRPTLFYWTLQDLARRFGAVIPERRDDRRA